MSFQFVDVWDFGTDSLLKHTPHGVVNCIEVRWVRRPESGRDKKSFKCTFNYCVDGSIWHFKFARVVQAHTLGEVGILSTVLWRVFSGTIPSNFYWNRFIFDREGAKHKLAQSFFETRCILAKHLIGGHSGEDWVFSVELSKDIQGCWDSWDYQCVSTSSMGNATSADLGSEASHDERDIRYGGQKQRSSEISSILHYRSPMSNQMSPCSLLRPWSLPIK